MREVCLLHYEKKSRFQEAAMPDYSEVIWFTRELKFLNPFRGNVPIYFIAYYYFAALAA